MNGRIAAAALAASMIAATPTFAQAPDKAETLIDAAKAATGGSAWDKVVTWHETGKVVGGGLQGTYESWADLTSLHDTSAYTLGPDSGSNGWDGKRAWTTDSSKEVRVETGKEAVTQAIQDAYRGAYAFYFPKRFASKREYSGTRSADGKTYDAVKITPQDAEPFELWFDPTTHRIAREVQLTGATPHTYILSDYAAFGGLQVPTQTVDRVGKDPKFDKLEAFGFAKVKSVSLGGLTLPDQLFGTMANSGWIAVEGADSAGLLGYEFAKRAVLSIDYAQRTLTLTKQEAFHPPTAVQAIPFKFDGHIPMVAGAIDGHAGEFEIDTGSRGALIVMHPFAASNGLVDRYHATRMVTVGYGVGGPSKALLARARELTLGGTTIAAPVTEFVADRSGAAAQTQTAGNIGGDLLKRYTVTFDYAHRLMWLQPNELAQQREVFDRAGVWIARAKDGGIEVVDVANESAADKTGLAPGDVIVAVNGKPARELALYDLREQFKAAAGTPFKLQVRGKQGERDLTLTLADQV